VVEAGRYELGLEEEQTEHRRAHLQSEGLAPGLLYKDAREVRKCPEKAAARAELLPIGQLAAAMVGFGVAGAVTALQEDFAGGSWEGSELAGQALHALLATSPKQLSGCTGQALAVAGTLGEGDSGRAAGAGGPDAGCA
jgi:hypothetical protein